jgi:hypothetical protein
MYTHTHTHIHTYIYLVKLAVKVNDQIENALNLIVSTAEQSGNMKKGLKQTIFKTVSTLQNLFVKLKVSRDSKTTEISKLEMHVIKMQAELAECSGKNAKAHGTPSLIHCHEPADIDGQGARHAFSYLLSRTRWDDSEESGATWWQGRKALL